MIYVVVVPVLILSTVRLYWMMMPFGSEGGNQWNVMLNVDGVERKFWGASSGTIYIKILIILHKWYQIWTKKVN